MMENNDVFDIRVVVNEITVTEDYWDMSFNIFVNGELKTAGGCGDDHCWGKHYKEFEKELRAHPLNYIMETMEGDWD